MNNRGAVLVATRVPVLRQVHSGTTNTPAGAGATLDFPNFNVVMVETIDAFLSSVGLSSVKDELFEEGFDTVERIALITNADLVEIPGLSDTDKRRILEAAAKLKERDETGRCARSSACFRIRCGF
jgi:hypothetical protein